MLLLGASRGAVDDLARAIAIEKGAIFGLHRLSFTQLAARVAANELAARGGAPASGLGHEAVAARAAFEAAHDEALEYFAPVSSTPGFPKALARTLLELRLAGVASASLGALKAQWRRSCRAARSRRHVDDRGGQRAIVLPCSRSQPKPSSTRPSSLTPGGGWPSMPTLLLDVPFDSEAEAQFLWALIETARHAHHRSLPVMRERSLSSRNVESRLNCSK